MHGKVAADQGLAGNIYTRSSLAVDFCDAAFLPALSEPRLVSVPVRSAFAAQRPMFQDLDARVFERDKSSRSISFFIHVLGIAAVLWLGMKLPSNTVRTTAPSEPVQITLYDPPLPLATPVAKVQGGGGSGGAHRLVAPIRGHLPTVVKAPTTPMMAPLEPSRIKTPKLPQEPVTQVRLPQDFSMPNVGAPQSQQVALASQGPGSAGGFGIGFGGGVGSGHGVGQGPGSNAGYGGLMNVGGGVSAPQVIHTVEPQFTPEARQADYQGVVTIQLIVDVQGEPQDVRVVRRLGMGLDERAIEAVKQYRFRPAVYQGHPVSVQMMIDVDFRLH